MRVALATVQELSDDYGVPAGTIRHWITKGRLSLKGTYQPTAGRVVALYDPQDVERLLGRL